MASPAVNINTGTTIVFGTSSWVAELTSINGAEATREAIDTTHLGTAAAGATEIGNATMIFGDIVKLGPIELEGHFNPDTVPPMDEASETMTITWKGGATWVSPGGMVKYTPEAGSGTDQKMTFSATWQPSDSIVVTPAT